MVTATISAINDIMDDNAYRELVIVTREMERPPYWYEGEGVNARLARAMRLVSDDKVTPNSDGSYTVEGLAGRTYRCAESCSCPNSQKSKSKWCYHMVGVALFIEWRRRVQGLVPPLASQVRASDPDALEEDRLRPMASRPLPLPESPEDQYPVDQVLDEEYPVDTDTLPLPLAPVSVDARLSQPAQEVRMAATDDGYIPEPADVATAVLGPPVAVHEAPAPLRIPKEYTVSIQGRTHVLYTGLVVAARTQGLLSLAADWTYNDAELSLAHAVATFADGRRYEESGDASPANVSKGIAKHFRRVALTRAKARCLRDALGISECSVEEMEEETRARDVPDMTPQASGQDLKQRLWQRIKVLAPEVARDEVGRWVYDTTKLALNPPNYAAILTALERQP